jgi:hypothetical protein
MHTLAHFHFTVTLENARIACICSQEATYLPLTPPVIEENVTIDGARFTMK